MIFIDTGPFVARYVAGDQHHLAAIEHWKHLEQERVPCLTSNLVLGETFTLLARRTDTRFAVERARKLLASRLLRILRPEEEDDARAIVYFQQFAAQGVSFVDCVSFALMQRHGVTRAFTFDQPLPWRVLPLNRKSRC